MGSAVFKQLCYMLLIAAMSFAWSGRNKFGEVQSAYASRLLLYFVNPCLIFNAFLVPYSNEKMIGLAISIAVSVAMHLAFTLLAILIRRKKEGDILIPFDRIGLVFTNCGFIGIPLISGALGQEAIFFLVGYIAVFNVYIWIYGAKEVNAPMSVLKIITNPNVLAVVFGIALFCLPVKLPQAVSQPLFYIGQANTALSMILLGMLFAQFMSEKHHTHGTYRRVAQVAAGRMVILSFAAVIITALAWQFVPHTQTARSALMACCIGALCPIGMSVSTFACVFARDNADGISPRSYSSLLVLSTSAISVITIPLFVRLAEVFIK